MANYEIVPVENKEEQKALADDLALNWIQQYTKIEIDGNAYRALVNAFLVALTKGTQTMTPFSKTPNKKLAQARDMFTDNEMKISDPKAAEQRVYYTVQSRSISQSGKWEFEGQCYTRSVNLAAHWDENQLDKIIPLIDLTNEETDGVEYRLVKVTEIVEVYHTPIKVTQMRLGS